MKMSKKTWMIIAIVGVVVLIYWLMNKNKKEETNKESGYGRRTIGSTGFSLDLVGKLNKGTKYYVCDRKGTAVQQCSTGTGLAYLDLAECNKNCTSNGCYCSTNIAGGGALAGDVRGGSSTM